MRPEDILAPDFKEQPYWWEAARPSREGALPLPAETDVAVVGSGYAGLCAALELQRNGTRAVVLEARDLGFGASTRSGGMVSGGINIAKGVDLVRRVGEERARALFEDGIASYDFLEDIIAREKIECAYAPVGRFVGAHTPAAFRAQAERARAITRLADLHIEMIPRARQHEELASDYYHGGMVVGRAGGLHPALYHRGLLEACRRAGVTLCPHTRVEGITRGSGGVQVRTSGGMVRAREAVVATNGYTGPATPWHRRRLIPVASYIIATEELGTERVRELFPKLRMVADSKRDLYYFRPSPDGTRVLFGARAYLAETGPRRGAVAVYRKMCRVFPQLRGVRITHAWNGYVAITWDALPHMGRHDGVFHCLGCNGSGVAMMGYLGHQTALRILGRSNRRCAFNDLPFETRPLYNGVPWFVPLGNAWYRLRDAVDRWAA